MECPDACSVSTDELRVTLHRAVLEQVGPGAYLFTQASQLGDVTWQSVP